MASLPFDVQARVEALESRLAKLESLVVPQRSPASAAETPPLATTPTQHVPPAPARHDTLAAFAPAQPIPPLSPTPSVPPTPVVVPRVHKPIPAHLTTISPDQASSNSLSLESLIGGRWFAIIGGLAVVIAVGLFLKLAIDQGWLGRLPPAARCGMGAFAGLVLLVLGERARTRIDAWAAVGLSSAGVASLYASTFAAYSLFHLFSQPVAFALLLACSAVGVFVGARAKLSVVAIVALIGAYATPFLLASAHPHPAVFPTHLLLLLATGLTLSAWLRGSFRSVGTFVWWGTILLGTLWFFSRSNRADEPLIGLSFLALTWAFIHASTIVATRPSAADPAPPSEEPYDHADPRSPLQVTLDSRPLLSSFSVTAWVVYLAVLTLRESHLLPDYLAPLAGVAATLTLALTLAGQLRLFVDPPTTPRQRLGIALLTQAGFLLITAIALAFSGATALFTYLALACAALVAAHWTRSRPLRLYAFIVLTFSTVRLFTYELIINSLLTKGEVYHGLYISTWTLIAAVTAAAWIFAGVIASLSDAEDSTDRAKSTDSAGRQVIRSSAPCLCTAMGLAILMASVMSEHSLASSVLYVWLLIGLAAAFTHALRSRLQLAQLGTGVVILSFAPWLVAYLPIGLAWPHPEGDAFLHPGLVSALAICAGLVVAARFALPRQGGHATVVLARAAYALALLLFWGSTSLELARHIAESSLTGTVALSAVSIYWAVFAVVLVVAGFWRATPAVRRTGLGLMALAGLKVVTIDLADAAAGWRILSFLVLGILMLAIAAGYSAIAKASALKRPTV